MEDAIIFDIPVDLGSTETDRSDATHVVATTPKGRFRVSLGHDGGLQVQLLDGKISVMPDCANTVQILGDIDVKAEAAREAKRLLNVHVANMRGMAAGPLDAGEKALLDGLSRRLKVHGSHPIPGDPQ